jgi:cytochrome c1
MSLSVPRAKKESEYDDEDANDEDANDEDANDEDSNANDEDAEEEDANEEGVDNTENDIMKEFDRIAADKKIQPPPDEDGSSTAPSLVDKMLSFFSSPTPTVTSPQAVYTPKSYTAEGCKKKKQQRRTCRR